MTPEEESIYGEGYQAACRAILSVIRPHLAPADMTDAKWIAERADVVLILRSVCRDHGDNDWPDDLYIADVIEKHLYKHLEDCSDERAENAL